MFDIYTPFFQHIGNIEKYTSMQWRRAYTKAGQFELHIPYNPLLVPENIIRNGNEAGIIENVNLTYSPEEGSMAEVRGRFLIGYLARRILLNSVNITETAENVMRTIVFDNLRDLGLTVAASQGYSGTIVYENQYGNLLKEVEAIAELTELGIKVDFDKVFTVYKGLDRSASQSVNPRAVFSRSFENVLSSEYNINTSKSINVVTDGINTVGTATGINRREGFASQNIDLAIEKVTEAFTAEVDPKGNLRYKRDYDLGDIVTIKEWNLKTDARITEINEIYEQGGMKLEITFGYERMMKIG